MKTKTFNIELLKKYSKDDVRELGNRADVLGLWSLTEDEKYVLSNYSDYINEANSLICNSIDYINEIILTDEPYYLGNLVLSLIQTDKYINQLKNNDVKFDKYDQEINKYCNNIKDNINNIDSILDKIVSDERDSKKKSYKVLHMTFKEYMEYCIEHDLEFDANIGDVDMDCTFCFSDDIVFTDYCMEKYGDLLKSNCEIRYGFKTPKNALPITDVVIVEYDNYKKAKEFALSLAGYISEEEWNKLFRK